MCGRNKSNASPSPLLSIRTHSSDRDHYSRKTRNFLLLRLAAAEPALLTLKPDWINVQQQYSSFIFFNLLCSFSSPSMLHFSPPLLVFGCRHQGQLHTFASGQVNIFVLFKSDIFLQRKRKERSNKNREADSCRPMC